MLFPFNNVEGYLSQEDRINLRVLSGQCSEIGGYFAEVGCYKGLSALCILQGAADNRAVVPLYCFDWFEDEKLSQFSANVRGAFPNSLVYEHRGDFKITASKLLWHLTFSFVFIDHSHTLADTKAAYDLFWPRITAGGVMVFHDYTHADYQEPRDFLDSLPHKRLLEGSMLALRKQ